MKRKERHQKTFTSKRTLRLSVEVLYTTQRTLASMTTTTFDTTVDTIIGNALELTDIFDAYSYFSSLNTESLLTDLVGSDSTTILDNLQNAGVNEQHSDTGV